MITTLLKSIRLCLCFKRRICHSLGEFSLSEIHSVHHFKHLDFDHVTQCSPIDFAKLKIACTNLWPNNTFKEPLMSYLVEKEIKTIKYTNS